MQNADHLPEERLCKNTLILFSEAKKKKKEREISSSSSYGDPLVFGADNSPPLCSPKKFGTKQSH